MFQALWDHRRPAGEDGDERLRTKRRHASVVVHALCSSGLMYHDRVRDGEGSAMRQKEMQTKGEEGDGRGKAAWDRGLSF